MNFRILSLSFFAFLLFSFTTLPFSARAKETLVIPGTGDSQQLLETIANAFEKINPGTDINIPESIGSTGGIKSVLFGKAVLARVARPLNSTEQKEGLEYLPFAFSPVIFAAHLESPCLQNLSKVQVIAIFSGDIDNWAQLGDCSDHTIYVANREPGDSSRAAIEKFMPEFKAIDKPVGKTVYSTPETIEVLQRYTHTIAYVPLAALKDSSLTVFSLDEVAPTLENIQENRYPLVTTLALVWRGKLSPLAEQFVAFLFSPKGQQLIHQQGLIPAKALE